MNLQQIKAEIITGQFTNQELNELAEAVRYSRSQLSNSVKSQLRVGQSVQFRSGRTGRMVQGTVKKVNIRYANVDTQIGQYRVPMNMLETI